MKPAWIVACALAGMSCARAKPVDPIEVRGAWARMADSGATTAVYLVIVNHEAAPVTLTAESSPLAESVGLHETMKMGDMVHMMALDSPPPIAAGDSLTLTEGAKHLMVSGLRRKLVAGDTVPLTLTLSDGRALHAVATVRAP